MHVVAEKSERPCSSLASSRARSLGSLVMTRVTLSQWRGLCALSRSLSPRSFFLLSLALALTRSLSFSLALTCSHSLSLLLSLSLALILSAMAYYRTVLLDQSPQGTRDHSESHTANFRDGSSMSAIPCSRRKPKWIQLNSTHRSPVITKV